MRPRFFVNFGKFAGTAPAAADPALSNSKARPVTGLALPSFLGQGPWEAARSWAAPAAGRLVYCFSVRMRKGPQQTQQTARNGPPSPLPGLLLQQLALQVLQHQVQGRDPPFRRVPHSRVGQVDDVPILIGLGSLDQVILHDLLGQLGPLCLDGSVPVQHEDIFWVPSPR